MDAAASAFLLVRGWDKKGGRNEITSGFRGSENSSGSRSLDLPRQMKQNKKVGKKMKIKMIVAAMLLLAVSVAPASAAMLVTVTASSGNLSATQQFIVQSTGGSSSWVLPASIALVDTYGSQLGTIKNLDIESNDDPYVNLRFAVEAGTLDTTFNISSSLVSSGIFVNPDLCYATAGVTLTSDSDGATIVGLFNGKVYQARYNSTAVFAELVNGYAIGADRTITSSERNPAIGSQTIFDSVATIQSDFSFTLSALDQASGTSRFEVVNAPEPATMSLLALGAIGLLAKRKRSNG